ncbi:hypothetical protein MRX96_037821 [Rhipicephalus microplus]
MTISRLRVRRFRAYGARRRPPPRQNTSPRYTPHKLPGNGASCMEKRSTKKQAVSRGVPAMPQGRKAHVGSGRRG